MKKKNNNINILKLTKADILKYLKNKLIKSKIEDILIISTSDFISSSSDVLNNIIHHFFPKDIIVRSSSKFEDSFYESNAGHFKSISNIKTTNYEEVKRGVTQVIKSYGDYNNEEEVLIQTQTKNVIVSGVVFTRDIKMNRPYYIINYEQSGNTNLVTSGSSCNTLIISRYINNNSIPNKWRKLIEAIKEIEKIFPNIALDIEFAITKESIVIFQVRPLSAIYKNALDKKSLLNRQEFDSVLNSYKKHYSKKLTCFSDMAFWNPVEIIGENPFLLDYSLYEELITDSSWNIGLIPLGYRKVPNKLMYCFGNKPYINLEYSFESLIPSDISDNLAKKLVDFYIKDFKLNISSHDKIEFEISHNCFDFSLYNRIQKLKKYNFTEQEIMNLENSLIKITENIINNYNDIVKKDLVDIDRLETIRNNMENKLKNCSDIKVITNCIKELMDSIKTLGTPQFSRQARCAFIGRSLINSLLNEKYISYEEYNCFMSSIHTITMDFNVDCNKIIEGKMSLKQFQLKYGHLRPGTYNIRSKRYDQISDLELISNYIIKNVSVENDFNNVDDIIIGVLDKTLKDYKIHNLKSNDILIFIKQSIEQREYFKFSFTKSVSYIIELIKKLGKLLNINNDLLSYLSILDIYKIDNSYDIESLKRKISYNKKYHNTFTELILPEVICSKLDIECFEPIDARPNFVSESIVSGEVVVLNKSYNKDDIKGKIVVVERADPGYDWVFLKGIAGIITKYGGVSSHLSIRCHEFNIPAAIGCGQKIFEYVKVSKTITIDCKNKKIF